MRDYQQETIARVAFIKQLLKESGAKGIVFGNSGGKDSALVGILCKMACDNTVGVILPCASKRNYGADADDGRELAEQFGIECRVVETPASAAGGSAGVGVFSFSNDATSDTPPTTAANSAMAMAGMRFFFGLSESVGGVCRRVIFISDFLPLLMSGVV